MTVRNWRDGTPSAVLASLIDETGRRGFMPGALEDLERLGVPDRVIVGLRAIAVTGHHYESRLVRTWIGLLADRHADVIGQGPAMALIGPSFSTEGMPIEDLQDLLSW